MALMALFSVGVNTAGQPPVPIPVSVIECTVTSGESTSHLRLITTILDPDTAPPQDLAEP
jgi:hypothetical protein